MGQAPLDFGYGKVILTMMLLLSVASFLIVFNSWKGNGASPVGKNGKIVEVAINFFNAEKNLTT
jgi:hypothetical protein